jgi:hypothetical protein
MPSPLTRMNTGTEIIFSSGFFLSLLFSFLSGDLITDFKVNSARKRRRHKKSRI